MQRDILQILKYFLFFQYPPTFEEVYMFYPKKISEKGLQDKINKLVRQKKLVEISFVGQNKPKTKRYTLGEYGIKNSKFKIQRSKIKTKYENSIKKIQKIIFFLKLLNLFPQIKLVGLSGSVAMMNAKENDDIDLFIITARNRLWTGRFIAIMLATVLGIKRKSYKLQATSYKNKVCLNLFFDEKRMEVPGLKKTEYVAHEILQMKPLIIKGGVYEKFLRANKWIYGFFPNAKTLNPNLQFTISNECYNLQFSNVWKLIIENSMKIVCSTNAQDNPECNRRIENGKLKITYLEKILMKIQLALINRHRTSELVTSSQLWFFPDDFERRLNQ